MNLKKLREEYRQSLKSSDTEEWFDLVFYRPLGFVWAVLARKLGVTPNAITIASIFIGIGAGIAFYYDDIRVNLLGALLLVWADSLDSADGQLARMTGQYSRLGRVLDGASSDIWFIAIYAAICLRENSTTAFWGTHPLMIWLLAAAAGASHVEQAAAADSYRQFHLFFLKGKSGSELDDSSDLWRKYRLLSWRRDFFDKLVLLFYANYTRGQERVAPQMQLLRRTLREKYGEHVPEKFRSRFRAESLPLMKYTNLLSFNLRSWALFIAVLLFRTPWLYFAFELTVMNVLLIYMVRCHESLCRRIRDKLHG